MSFLFHVCPLPRDELKTEYANKQDVINLLQEAAPEEEDV
jgi:hypothetical protein